MEGLGVSDDDDSDDAAGDHIKCDEIDDNAPVKVRTFMRSFPLTFVRQESYRLCTTCAVHITTLFKE